MVAKRLGWTPEAMLPRTRSRGPSFPSTARISVQALGTMQDMLLEHGLIKKRLPIEEHFTKEFSPVRI